MSREDCMNEKHCLHEVERLKPSERHGPFVPTITLTKYIIKVCCWCEHEEEEKE